MSTVRYTVLDGELLSENRNATKRDYVPDPLGSTIALLDNTQTQTDTFTYWPYGEVASRTGSTATPFQYGGTLGYYTDGSSGPLYVRARHYSSTSGRWISEDPIGFDGGDYNLYRYAGNSPVNWTDPTGFKPRPEKGCKEAKEFQAAIDLACGKLLFGGWHCFTRGVDSIVVGALKGMADWCNQDNIVGCGSPKCASENNSHSTLCGYSNLLFSGIVLCPSAMRKSFCLSPTSNDPILGLALTFLHELAHIGGIGDRVDVCGIPHSYNPAEHVARCLLGIPGDIPAYGF